MMRNGLLCIVLAGMLAAAVGEYANAGPRSLAQRRFDVFGYVEAANDPVPSIRQGLIAYYPFDSNAQDYSGLGNNGSLYGTVTNVSGKVGNAYSFMGGDKYVTIPDTSTLRMTNSSYSLSAWVYNITARNEAGIMAKAMLPSSGPGYGFMLWTRQQATISGSPPGGWMVRTNSLPDSTWTHIATTFDKTTAIARMYINGALAASSTNVLSVPQNYNAPLLIGNWRSGEYYLEGYIDEACVWNRVVSGDEFSQIYNGGAGLSLRVD